MGGRGLEAARVVYRSTSGDDGQPTLVSGSVFVPKGDAPDGGWPVVSMGHGTLGVDMSCGPSLYSSLLGVLRYVRELTSLGYAVAYADFQGLGTKGIHPYTDSRTAGLNMIDAVRALRKTFPDVSDRWVAVGHSQGGARLGPPTSRRDAMRRNCGCSVRSRRRPAPTCPAWSTRPRPER